MMRTDLVFFFFFNDTATTEIYTLHIVGSVRCVQETGNIQSYLNQEGYPHTNNFRVNSSQKSPLDSNKQNANLNQSNINNRQSQIGDKKNYVISNSSNTKPDKQKSRSSSKTGLQIEEISKSNKKQISTEDNLFNNNNNSNNNGYSGVTSTNIPGNNNLLNQRVNLSNMSNLNNYQTEDIIEQNNKINQLILERCKKIVAGQIN
eukprot:TRINITY_DN2370_c0_g1_i13.p1 TRINITY_DN2370_c0_g1~~TRINITY_DN2370_c0_g1_i13.p1  ORF type:complete len:204 (-),score=56.40 TRINITY_DN2370_c0_g1_i13:377-988(-)